MDNDRIDTAEQLANERAYRTKHGWLGWGLFFLALAALASLSEYLGYAIEPKELPHSLAPLWFPPFILMALMLPFWGLLRIVLHLVGADRRIPVRRAIFAYDASHREFQKWKNKANKEALLRSYLLLDRCSPVLDDLDEFARFREEVGSSYRKVFGGLQSNSENR